MRLGLEHRKVYVRAHPSPIEKSSSYLSIEFTNQDRALWALFKKLSKREDELNARIQQLTNSLNKQNANLHKQGLQNQQAQIHLNNANARMMEVEAAYHETLRYQSTLEQQIEQERKKTLDGEEELRLVKESLAHEFKLAAQSDKDKERLSKAFEGVCQFVNQITVASREGKEFLIEGLIDSSDLGRLMIDAEERKRNLDEKEERFRQEKMEFEQTFNKERLRRQESVHAKDQAIAELDGNRLWPSSPGDSMDQDMVEPALQVPVKRRAKVERKHPRAIEAKNGIIESVGA